MTTFYTYPAHTPRTGRNENIALIVPDLTNPFMPPIAHAVQKEAAKLGYCVFIGNADENPSHEEDLLLRFSDQVAGAVLASPRSDQATIEGLAASIPLVLINRDVRGVPRVLIDAGFGMAKALAHLATLGHARIAYISGPPQSWANEQRLRSVEKAALAHDVALDVIAADTASFSSGTEVVIYFWRLARARSSPLTMCWRRAFAMGWPNGISMFLEK